MDGGLLLGGGVPNSCDHQHYFELFLTIQIPRPCARVFNKISIDGGLGICNLESSGDWLGLKISNPVVLSVPSIIERCRDSSSSVLGRLTLRWFRVHYLLGILPAA